VRGGAYEVLSGTAFLAEQQVDGLVLDMARASAGPGAPGGDWAFLLTQGGAFFVLAADEEHRGDADPTYRGWGDDEGSEMQWADVRVTWARTEAFPPSRRDVPVEWRIETEDGGLSGDLEAVSAELQPGEGPGPLLPVRGLYVVAGELATERGRFRVRGILVHERR
jgi:hypothetical protein